MADYLEDVDRFDLIERLLRREQIVRDKLKITYYNHTDLMTKFRLSNEALLLILGNIGRFVQ